MDIYCLQISIAECPCMDIRAWISMWISTLVWIIGTDIQKVWISMLISVDFWKSMHGFAMDSRTRATGPELVLQNKGQRRPFSQKKSMKDQLDLQ